jgi:hypothetical protein
VYGDAVAEARGGTYCLSMEARIEPDPVIEAYKPGVDFTLCLENLKLTVEQRIINLMNLQRAAEELRNASRRKPDR